METPPFDVVTRLVGALRGAGLTPALGGSGLLVALGLAGTAHDWDLTVDAPEPRVRAALDAGGFSYADRTSATVPYATARRFVVAAGDHDIDLLLHFALHGPAGPEPLPTRVTGTWRGLPLADPAVWARAYDLLGRPEKAAALRAWLAGR